MATYRVPVLEDFAWQPPVDDRLTNASVHSDVAKGDRYIVTATASDMFVGEENNIATAKISGASAAGDWMFDTPAEGHATWVLDENKLYRFDGSDWAEEDLTTIQSQVLVLESEISSVSLAISNVSSGLSQAISELLVEKSVVNDVSEAVVDLIISHGSTASIVSALAVDKQDNGTYVSEYGAIQFTV